MRRNSDEKSAIVCPRSGISKSQRYHRALCPWPPGILSESLPHLWSSSQSPWLHTQRSRFDSPRYHIFWEVVGLERVPLSLASTTEELLGWKSSGSDLESREYGREDPSRWPRDSLHPQKLVLTSPISDGRSVGIVHSRTQATEYFLWAIVMYLYVYKTLYTYMKVLRALDL
jgi:hypothetical protein